MRSKQVFRTILVKVVSLLNEQGEHRAASALMDYIREYFPIFT